MKVSLKSIKKSVKNIPWTKIGKKTVNIAKYTALAGVVLMTVKSCAENEKKLDAKRTKQQEEIKEKDIDRYNKLMETIGLGKEYGGYTFWDKEYKKMNDSIRISQRAYFEGAQMVRDSLKNSK